MSLKITIKPLTSEAFEVDVAEATTVAELKDLILEKRGIANYRQALVLGKQPLEDAQPLSEYEIKSGVTLTLLIKDTDSKLKGKTLFQKLRDGPDEQKMASMRLHLNNDEGKCLLAVRWKSDWEDEYVTSGGCSKYHTFHLEYHRLLKGTFVMDGDTVVCTWEKSAKYTHCLDGSHICGDFSAPIPEWKLEPESSPFCFAKDWERLSLSNLQQVEQMSEGKSGLEVLKPSELSLGLFEAQKIDELILIFGDNFNATGS